MRYLLDTNVFIFLNEEFEALSDQQQQLLTDPINEFVLSTASVWEMAIKTRLSKLSFPTGGTFESVVTAGRRRQGIALLPIRQRHVQAVARLPKVTNHGDPFDLFIITQALTEQLPILTTDRYFAYYPGLQVIG